MIDWKILNNEVYLYDGTFNGLLSVAFYCYINKAIPCNVVAEEKYIHNLLETARFIPTSEVSAERVFNGMYRVASKEAVYDCYNAFLSGNANKELPILKYILNSFEIGPNICNMLSIDYVLDVVKLRKNVLMEAHRFDGLVRLQEIGNNLWYASVHPDNNIIENVGQFLMRRFPMQNLILHDKNRNLAFMYSVLKPNNYEIIEVPENIQFSIFSEDEIKFQSLWKIFFKSVVIKERTNPRLQMQFMPKKYWKDLTEVS